MPRGLEHGALGFENAVFPTALLVVVVDDEDGERGHGKGLGLEEPGFGNPHFA